MKRLLYVDCCIRGQTSRTRRLAEAFLDALPQGWAVEPLELAAEGLQYFSGPFFQQRQDLLAAGNRTHPRFRYAWQFAQADAIVLAAPLWDLSFPALLKVYIENVSVENITFGCGEAGCYGICQARRMVFLTARGAPGIRLWDRFRRWMAARQSRKRWCIRLTMGPSALSWMRNRFSCWVSKQNQPSAGGRVGSPPVRRRTHCTWSGQVFWPDAGSSAKAFYSYR